MLFSFFVFFFQAEDGIRDLVRSRGLGDVYKRQPLLCAPCATKGSRTTMFSEPAFWVLVVAAALIGARLFYTSDAADERACVDLGGRRIIKKKKTSQSEGWRSHENRTSSERKENTGK